VHGIQAEFCCARTCTHPVGSKRSVSAQAHPKARMNTRTHQRATEHDGEAFLERSGCQNACCSRGRVPTNGSTVSKNVAMATVTFSLDFHCCALNRMQ
jgi:hypothetical protein